MRPTLLLIASASALLLTTAGPKASHAQADQALKRCKSTAKTLLEKLESKGGSYVNTFNRWEKTCVKDAAPLEALAGYEDITATYKKLKPIADVYNAEYEYDIVISDTWHWVGRDLGSVQFHIDRDKDSRRYKEAMETLADCKEKLGSLFKKYPKAKKEKHEHDEERTLQDVYGECAGGAIAKNEAKREKRNQERAATHKGYIMDAERKYLSSMETFNKYQKVAKNNKKYGALQAIRNYDYVIRDLSKVSGTVSDALRDEPTLKKAKLKFAGKSLTGTKLQKQVAGDLKSAKSAAKKINSKVAKQYKQWQKEFKQRAKGDRKKIFRKYGQPDFYDGRNLDDPAERLKKATKTGSWWIYNTGSCEVRYDFRKNRKITKKVSPITCRAH